MPPGEYKAWRPRIYFSEFGEPYADNVFGTGVEYLIEKVRCGIIWDDSTQTNAMMLAVRFTSYNERWRHLQMWSNVARMELQHNRYGEPGTVNWFAKFRKEE